MIIAILAAGLSERFGSFKPLATFKGKSLIEHGIDALPSKYPQYIIVGHKRELLESCLKGKSIKPLFNPEYEKGILYSVLTALKKARDENEDLLITLGDLPFITLENYQALIQEFIGRPLFSSFEGQIGPPAIIPLASIKSYLDNVGDNLEGLIPLKTYFKDCDHYPMAAAGKDIDNASDWS